MKVLNLKGLFLTGVIAVGMTGAQAITGYNEPAGFTASNLNLSGAEIAVSPDGKLAVGMDNAAGGATITVYDQVGAGRTAIASFTAPTGDTFKFISGLAWKDANTLVFAENGDMDTLYSADVSGNQITKLAPNGTLPNVGQIAFRPADQTLFALLVNAPGAGAVVSFNNGVVTPFAGNLGNGFLSGIAFRNDGALFVGDSNDPNFSGNPGQIFELNSSGGIANTLSLAGGGGSGLYDFVFDSEGDLIATTGASLSLIKAGTNGAQPFGTFTGAFPFPTSLDYFGNGFEPGSGNGTLLVNGIFAGPGDIFAVQPVPEPATLAALTGMLGLLAARRKQR